MKLTTKLNHHFAASLFPHHYDVMSFSTSMNTNRGQGLQDDFWERGQGGLAPFFLADGHISGLRSS